MLCANCGTSNQDDEKFCRGCLQPISAVWQSPKSELVSSSGTLVADGEYAGFWRRFAAVFLDGIILWLLFIPVGAVFGGVAVMAGLSSSGGLIGLANLLNFLMFIVAIAYYVLMESGERGATYGKRIVKLRVVTVDGERIGVGRALLRYVAHFLSYITFFIGFLMQPFTEKKQALHDMVSGTVVVRTDEGGSAGIVVAIVGLFLFMTVGIGIMAAVAIPAYQDYIVKAKMAQVMQTGNMASKAVETFYAQAGRYPESMAETGAPLQKPAFISDIEVNPGTGEVQVTFGDREPRSVAGKSISFKPTRYTDGSFVWACSSSEISPKLLPKDCK